MIFLAAFTKRARPFSLPPFSFLRGGSGSGIIEID
jgi:hypothetical protein